MKMFVICLLMFGMIQTGHSQIVLEETEVEYAPYDMKMEGVSNTLIFKIPERHVGEFHEDPLAFIEDRFDAGELARQNKDQDFIFYQVDFKTKKGNVLAKYDANGEMISTSQRFKDVKLPDDVKLEILRNYRNSRILKNRHVVTSKKWLIDKEYYKIKLHDGEKIRKMRIQRNAQGLELVGL